MSTIDEDLVVLPGDLFMPPDEEPERGPRDLLADLLEGHTFTEATIEDIGPNRVRLSIAHEVEGDLNRPSDIGWQLRLLAAECMRLAICLGARFESHRRAG